MSNLIFVQFRKPPCPLRAYFAEVSEEFSRAQKDLERSRETARKKAAGQQQQRRKKTFRRFFYPFCRGLFHRNFHLPNVYFPVN